MLIITVDIILALIKCAALDSDDLLYLKEQMEAEEDAERLRRRTEKRAFAAFKISSGSLICWISSGVSKNYNKFGVREPT